MVRVLLLNPPLPVRNGTPLLSQMYIASSLLNNGHEVRIIDLNAKYYKYNFKKIISEIKTYQPNVICFGLYTSTARFVYDFVLQLKSTGNFDDSLFIAGGPHATTLPEEPLIHNFDIVVRGEGEYAIGDVMDYIKENKNLKRIKGISYKDSNGIPHHNSPRPLIQDLDSIPLAIDAIPLIESSWYFKNGKMQDLPAGLITSRGCPAKCIFCANLVTGRKFRFRSIENVLDELKFYILNYGTTFFSFWDDTFTSNTNRTFNLCKELIRLNKAHGIKIQWLCNTRADKLSQKLVKEMVSAGCVSITFGIESGSPETLTRIRKGINLKQVVRSLKWCKAEGVRTQVNFMLGFPWEREKHLQETLEFMIKINELVDAYSARGVVIPYAGTELYEKYKDQYCFDSWWLEKKSDLIDKSNDLKDIYLNDPVLDLDFFKYSPDVKRMIQKCLEYKGEQTISKLGI